MKKRLIMMGIVLMIIIGLYGVSYSQDSDIDKSKEVFCRGIAEAAGFAMTARQCGMTIEQMLDNLQADPASYEYKISIRLYKAAYTKPIYDTKEKKMKAIDDFCDEIYTICIKGGL